MLALLGIRRKARDQLLDLRKQRLAPDIDRRPVERRAAEQAIEAILREHRAERRRHRDPALGVEPQEIMGDEPVHVPLQIARNAGLGTYGLSWDYMGVKWVRPMRLRAAEAAFRRTNH